MHYGSYEFTLLELILGCLFWCSGNLSQQEIYFDVEFVLFFQRSDEQDQEDG